MSVTNHVSGTIMQFAPALVQGFANARAHSEAVQTDYYAAQKIREVGQRLVAATERIVELEAQHASERSRRIRAEAAHPGGDGSLNPKRRRPRFAPGAFSVGTFHFVGQRATFWVGASSSRNVDASSVGSLLADGVELDLGHGRVRSERQDGRDTNYAGRAIDVGLKCCPGRAA